MTPADRHRLQYAVALLLAITAIDAQAYIDPNAGGLLYQILLPVIVAIVATWRYLKASVVALWQRLFAHKKRAGDDTQ